MTIIVKITTGVRPFFNGRASDLNEVLEVSKNDADLIIKNNWGELVNKDKPMKKVRARLNGRFLADDPNTEKNEAWVNDD